VEVANPDMKAMDNSYSIHLNESEPSNLY